MDRPKEFDVKLQEAIPGMRYFSKKLCRRPADAEDLLSRTVLKAIANWQQWRLDSSMFAWVRTIMYNDYINEIRRPYNRYDLLRSLEHEGGTEELDTALWHNPTCEAAEDLRRVARVLAVLSAAHANVLLKHALGYKYQEIAVMYGIEEGTVKSRLNRARAELRKHLARRGEIV